MSRHFNACYKCPDRQLGCHKDCEKYLAERRAYEQMKERKKKHEKIDGILKGMKKR